jgi:hypothetical protein
VIIRTLVRARESDVSRCFREEMTPVSSMLSGCFRSAQDEERRDPARGAADEPRSEEHRRDDDQLTQRGRERRRVVEQVDERRHDLRPG